MASRADTEGFDSFEDTKFFLNFKECRETGSFLIIFGRFEYFSEAIIMRSILLVVFCD